MSNEQNNIDDLFRGKLRDYSVDAPEHVWSGIVAGRQPLSKALQFLKLNKGGVAIALLLMIAGGTVTYMSVGKSESPVAYNATSTANKPAPQVDNSISAVQSNTATTATTLATTSASATDGGDIAASMPVRSVSNPATPGTIGGSNGNDANGNEAQPVIQEATAQTVTETVEATENERAQLADVETLPLIVAKSPTPLFRSANGSGYPFESLSLLGPDKAEGLSSTTVKPPKMQKWSFDVYTSLDFTSRSLTADGASKNYVDAKQKAEKYNPGFSFGARVNYDLTKCVKACIPTKLRVGLQYTTLGEKVKFENKVENTTITTKTVYKYDIFGNVIGSETMPDTITTTRDVKSSNCNMYSFIDLPVQLEMQLYGNQKLSVFTTVGGVANLRFMQSGQRIKTDLSGVEGMRGTGNPYKTNAGFSALAGVGMEYKMCSGFSLLAEGTYRHGLNNVMNSDAGMRQNMRSISATVGMRYSF